MDKVTKQDVLKQINFITIAAQKIRSTVEPYITIDKGQLDTSHIVTLGTTICDSDRPTFIQVYNLYHLVGRDDVLDVQLFIQDIEPYELSMVEIRDLFPVV